MRRASDDYSACWCGAPPPPPSHPEVRTRLRRLGQSPPATLGEPPPPFRPGRHGKLELELAGGQFSAPQVGASSESFFIQIPSVLVFFLRLAWLQRKLVLTSHSLDPCSSADREASADNGPSGSNTRFQVTITGHWLSYRLSDMHHKVRSSEDAMMRVVRGPLEESASSR